ncbi:MAG: GNAT family N-acetyltransferase [Vagococcus sp.]
MVIIRKAKKEDAQAIALLVGNIVFYYIEDREAKKQLYKKLVELIKKNNSAVSYNVVSVLTDDEQVVGMISHYPYKNDQLLFKPVLNLIQEYEKEDLNVEANQQLTFNESYYINMLAISKEARGKGFAKSLITAIEETARTKQFKSIILKADTTNTSANRLYESLGYEIIENIKEDDVTNLYIFQKKL